jgi:HlyD family secretion protein
MIGMLSFGAAVVLPVALLRAPVEDRMVTSLGRIEPKDGVVRVAGPSSPPSVIKELLVEKGQRVREGQRIAVLDTHAVRKAELRRLEAVLGQADRELRRLEKLHAEDVSSEAALEEARLERIVATAALERAAAELDLSVVIAPIAGTVLEIHAHAGERVGEEGIVELGRTDEMYAVAEVYETDVGLVRVGQRARITSSALVDPIEGTVERIGLKIGKMDVLGTDPAARTDARVVEVEIGLDDDARVSGLTNLQVQVEIEL